MEEPDDHQLPCCICYVHHRGDLTHLRPWRRWKEVIIRDPGDGGIDIVILGAVFNVHCCMDASVCSSHFGHHRGDNVCVIDIEQETCKGGIGDGAHPIRLRLHVVDPLIF